MVHCRRRAGWAGGVGGAAARGRSCPAPTHLRSLARFLVGRVFTDPINTLIVFMASHGQRGWVPASRRAGPAACQYRCSPWQAAFCGCGRRSHRTQTDAMNIVLVMWMVALAAVAAIGLLDLSRAGCSGAWQRWPAWRWVAPGLPTSHAASGAAAVCGRVLWAVRDGGPLCSIIGPFLWGYVADTLGWDVRSGAEPAGIRGDRIRDPVRRR